MREWEITWLPRNKPIPTDGEYVELPEYCHHGRYVSGMVVREINPEPDRCFFCGHPDPKTDDRAGSVVMTCCNQKISTCCPGAADGQSG